MGNTSSALSGSVMVALRRRGGFPVPSSVLEQAFRRPIIPDHVAQKIPSIHNAKVILKQTKSPAVEAPNAISDKARHISCRYYPLRRASPGSHVLLARLKIAYELMNGTEAVSYRCKLQSLDGCLSAAAILRTRAEVISPARLSSPVAQPMPSLEVSAIYDIWVVENSSRAGLH